MVQNKNIETLGHGIQRQQINISPDMRRDMRQDPESGAQTG